MKAVVEDMAPLTQTFLRSLGGTALLALWFVSQRRNPFRAPTGPSMLLGLLFVMPILAGAYYVSFRQVLTSPADGAEHGPE